MTLYDLIDHFYDQYTKTFPTELASTVVTAVGGSTIEAADIAGGADDGWKFGICEFLDGPAQGRFKVVMSSTATKLNFGSTSIPSKRPVAGNTFRLFGGSLAVAKTNGLIFRHEPQAIPESALTNVILVMHIPELSDSPRVLGRDPAGAYTQEVVIATEQSLPIKLAANLDGQKAYWKDLMMLQEQVRAVYRASRRASELGVWGAREISSRWALIPRQAHRTGFFTSARFQSQV